MLSAFVFHSSFAISPHTVAVSMSPEAPTASAMPVTEGLPVAWPLPTKTMPGNPDGRTGPAKAMPSLEQ